MDKVKWLKRGGWAVYLFWHLLFVIIAVAILLPYLTLPMINSARIDSVPWTYAVYVALLTVIPFVSLVIVWLHFRSDVMAALKLFYAVELPLMLLLLLRVMLFREAPFAAQFLFLNIGIGITAYFVMLWRTASGHAEMGGIIELGFSSVVALVGVYLGLLLSIALFPIALSLLGELWLSLEHISWDAIADYLEALINKPLLMLFVLLMFITVAFFLITPLLLISAYLHQFIVRCRIACWSRIAIVVLTLLLFEVLMFSQSNEQAQARAFELTETLPTDLQSRRELLAEAETVREGLLAAYLGAYRYLSTTGNSRSIAKSYGDIFGRRSLIAHYAQTLFNGLASPFLYQGEDFMHDRNLAADRYQQFFDTPIEKAERESLVAAVKATWENEQNEAGLMNAASHQVLLTDQSIKIEEQGDMATVTITQTLVNQTYQPQEVLFHFELPEDAVVTGLWMSDDSENPEKFKHVVSPRGAAQAVYKAEVRRRIDPALLEKVGPVQYRLRAFPIPARQVASNRGGNRYTKAYRDFSAAAALVQFQYVVSIDTDGRWPMPLLLEQRNVYWDEQTVRSHKTLSPFAWLPVSLEASNSALAQTHTALIDGATVRAVARDARKPVTTFTAPIAVIVDGSYSMNQVQGALREQLQWLQHSGLDYRLFFCQTSCAVTDINALEEQVYFGNSQLLQQLSQWAATAADHYSSVFVLSDAGSYELSANEQEVFNTPLQPLWLIHLSEQLPYAYNDAVIDAVVDSDGGIAHTLAAATEKFLWLQQVNQSTAEGRLIGVSPRYFWYQLDELSTATVGPFSVLAADRWINHLAASSDKAQLATLDAIHDIASQYDIVSFYSSMLVLVEDRQRQLLKEAEVRDDRFEREVETGEETLANPLDPFAVPGVPEPEEWALLMVAGCLLLIAYTRRRRFTRNFRNTADIKILLS